MQYVMAEDRHLWRLGTGYMAVSCIEPYNYYYYYYYYLLIGLGISVSSSGSFSDTTTILKCGLGLERGPRSLVRTIE